MKFAQETPAGSHVITAYAPGRLDIDERPVTASVIVTPDKVFDDWAPQAFEDLDASHFERLLDLEPEVVIVGTGARLQFPAPALTACLMERGIGVEIMDTAAACRTYNILMNEARRVVAALLMI